MHAPLLGGLEWFIHVLRVTWPVGGLALVNARCGSSLP